MGISMTAMAAPMPTLSWSAVGADFLLKSVVGDDLFVAGYASVDMVDKQGDRIPTVALKKAFGQFMTNKAFRNVQLAHSGIQVGEVVDNHTDSDGRVWKSEVDDHGLFVVCRIRSDIQKAREVQKQIRDGDLRSFSIGGQALFRVSKTTPEHGSHREITDLELHEITLCKKGINPEARYSILKMDNTNETVKKMTETAEALTEIRDSLAHVLKALDKGEEKDMKEEKEMKEMKGMKEDKMYAEDKMKSEENVDGALAYIDTLEKFVHDAGVDLDSIRSRFGLEKAYMVGVDGQGGYSHRGQGDEIGSGEDASEAAKPALAAPGGNKYVIKTGGVPNMNMNAPSGGSNVIKAGDVTPESLERGYRAYAAMRDEESLKSVVKSDWEARYNAETARAEEVRKSRDYSGQIDALKAEISSLRSESADIVKSASAVPETDIRVPTNEEFSQMGDGIDGWRATEELARRALRGE
jgi:HK97 family phage prohead protease